MSDEMSEAETLVAEVGRLRAENAQLKAELDNMRRDKFTMERNTCEIVNALYRDIDKLKAELAEARLTRRADMLAGRGMSEDEACEKCGGIGVALYGSTATWHGGIGGQAMTHDVCSRCWGSGNRCRPWPSWKDTEKLKATIATATQREARRDKWLKKSCWVEVRNILELGAAIYQDYQGGRYSGYEEYSAHVDDVARKRSEKIEHALEEAGS